VGKADGGDERAVSASLSAASSSAGDIEAMSVVSSEPDWTKDDGLDKAAKKAAKEARQRADAAAKKEAETPLATIPENEEAQKMRVTIVTCKVVEPDAKLEWPITKCSSPSCSHAEKWHKMRNWKVWTNEPIPEDVAKRNVEKKNKEGAPPSPEAGTALSVCRGAGKVDGGGGGTGSSAASASSGTSATPPPPPPGAVGLGWWKWMCMCVCCVASSRGITLQEAKACIEEEDPMHQSKVKRAQGFAAARQKVLDGDDVQMMSGDRKTYEEIRAITLNFLEALLMPLLRSTSSARPLPWTCSRPRAGRPCCCRPS
jgi:hypothetical protein